MAAKLKWHYTDTEIEEQIKSARKRSQESEKKELRAKRAYYYRKSRHIVIEFVNGCEFSFPKNKIKELINASPEKIAEVTVTPQGLGLHWERLDADYSIGGLLAGIFGTKSWMAELGRKGGIAKTPAKISAARKNGQKGGRPRKGASKFH